MFYTKSFQNCIKLSRSVSTQLYTSAIYINWKQFVNEIKSECFQKYAFTEQMFVCSVKEYFEEYSDFISLKIVFSTYF